MDATCYVRKGKRVKEILGDAPDIVFEHVGRETFPTSVFVCKPFGKVVICGATSGFQLDFDVRYLWRGLIDVPQDGRPAVGASDDFLAA